MFEIMIAVFYYAFYVSLLLWASLFIYRCIFVIKEKYGLKETLMVLFIPLSIGYYKIVLEPKQSPFYTLLVVLTFLCGLIASLLPIYMHLRLNMI